jgi:hypothetical protein
MRRTVAAAKALEADSQGGRGYNLQGIARQEGIETEGENGARSSVGKDRQPKGTA